VTFPRHVYKSPGPYAKTASHPTWGCATVNDEADLADALATGNWFETVEEAIEAAGINAYPKLKGKARVRELRKRKVVEIMDNGPPTRSEMEMQAKKLGIGYNARTSDQVLLSRISEVMRSGLHKTAIR
jgi:CRISPR/Cas system-associated endonuclease Cas3-HD